jgi:hypothetical protein
MDKVRQEKATNIILAADSGEIEKRVQGLDRNPG